MPFQVTTHSNEPNESCKLYLHPEAAIASFANCKREWSFSFLLCLVFAYSITNEMYFICSVLEPSSLHCGIYPSLTSYSTPDKQAYPRHSLSRAALLTSDSPIFFLDAYTTLIVFYTSTADPSLPFPPPQDCKFAR